MVKLTSLSEMYILKMALKEKILRPEKLKEALKGEGPLKDFLLEEKFLQPDQWDHLRQQAKQQPHWPQNPQQISLDNQIIYQKFQHNPHVHLGSFNHAWQVCEEKPSLSSPWRLHEILIRAGMLSEDEALDILGIIPNCLLICLRCGQEVRFYNYYPWKPYPCLFCQGFLALTTTQTSGEREVH